MRKGITTALFSLIFVLLMIAPVAVFADAGSISAGEEKSINSSCEFTFTPEESGYYDFESYGRDTEIDTEASIFLGDECIAEDDDSGEDLMFFIRFYAEAGKTYRLGVKTLENTTFKIHVIKDNNTGIRFELTKPLEIIENSHGEMDVDNNGEDFYCYNEFKFNDGDKFILSTIDGDEEFIYDNFTRKFRGENGSIRVSKLSWDIEKLQRESPWKLGEHDFTVWYRGLEYKLTLAIVETPVESLRFIPKKPCVLTENRNGFWDYDINYKKYYRYDFIFINKGDRLIVGMKDGTVAEYVYSEDEEEFINVEGEILDWELQVTQYEKPWKLGSDNYFTISALGKPLKVPVTIKKQNTLSAKGETVSIKYNTLKKKTQTIKTAKAFTVKNPKGDVTYKVAKYDKKAKMKITVAKKGKVTVKKGLKKGTYKVQVKVTAAGNSKYSAKTVKTTLKIVVK